MSPTFALALAACASAPPPPAGPYVPPTELAALTCDELHSEFIRLHGEVTRITAPDAPAFRRHRATVGKAPFVLWPAVFLLTAPERHGELQPLKDLYDSLFDIALRSECQVVKQLL